jgi:hypothetical protein
MKNYEYYGEKLKRILQEEAKKDNLDELFARYLAETMKDDEIEKLNGDKIELLKFLSK